MISAYGIRIATTAQYKNRFIHRFLVSFSRQPTLKTNSSNIPA
jgi:hypothetical protein